jgi:hypothetical protein
VDDFAAVVVEVFFQRVLGWVHIEFDLNFLTQRHRDQRVSQKEKGTKNKTLNTNNKKQITNNK